MGEHTKASLGFQSAECCVHACHSTHSCCDRKHESSNQVQSGYPRLSVDDMYSSCHAAPSAAFESGWLLESRDEVMRSPEPVDP